MSGYCSVENERSFSLVRGQYGDSGEGVQDFLNLVSAVRIGPGAPQLSLHLRCFLRHVLSGQVAKWAG